MESSNQNLEISTVSLKGLPAQEVWDLVMKDKLRWLEHFYQQKQVASSDQGSQSINSGEQFNKIKRLFQELRNSIEKSQANKGGKYFEKFKHIQSNKYFQKAVRLNDRFKSKQKIQAQKKSLLTQEMKSSSQKSSVIIKSEKDQRIQFFQGYKKALLENHQRIIEYLTLERYSFTNVAMHIYQKGQKHKGFYFFVERGKDLLKPQLSEVLLYMFIRDLTIGLIELQQHLILHLDVDLRNILLFLHNYPNGSQKLKGLNLQIYSQIKEVIQALRFKIIDFGDAMILTNNYEEQNKDLMKSTSNADYYITSSIFDKQEIDKTSIAKAISLMQKDVQKKKIIRKIHSKFFKKCIHGMGLLTQQMNQQSQKYYQKLFISDDKQDDYKKIITEMEKNISEYKEK